MMEPVSVVGSALDLVGAIIWLLAVLALAVMLIVKGGKPRLGGLRLVGGGMILYALAGILGDVLTLRALVDLVYNLVGYGAGQVYLGAGTILGALVDAGVLALVVLGLGKLAGDLVEE